MQAFAHLQFIHRTYLAVLTHRTIEVPASFLRGVVQKLDNTVNFLGFGVLANGIIEKTRLLSQNQINPMREHVKTALKMHILLPSQRLSDPSREMRLFLRYLCDFGSTGNLGVVEEWWRDVITDHVTDECHRCMQTIDHSAATSDKTMVTFAPTEDVSVRANRLVRQLMAMLAEFRHLSRMEMVVTSQCAMSADLAFVTAFRRLPSELATELTKALVVRISSLIDVQKEQSSQSHWAAAVDGVIDLIQVVIVQIFVHLFLFYSYPLLFLIIDN